jgi:hypothetical protein
VQTLDCRHLPARLGDFDAVADQDDPAIESEKTWVRGQDQGNPELSELGQVEGWGMEQVEDSIVAVGQ